MRTKLLFAAILAVFLFTSSAAQAQWVFVARKAKGVIQNMKGPTNDVATVVLGAKADNVYSTALNTLKAKHNLRITSSSDKSRTVEFTDGVTPAKMKVTPIDADQCELQVSSPLTQGSPDGTSVVLDGVFRICNEMKVKCTLEKGS